jgi:hypothetical protein
VYLRQESEDWKEETRRKDTIIISLTQRIPELEAPLESQEAPVMPSEVPTKGTPPPSEPEEPSQRRSWLHRFFFGTS